MGNNLAELLYMAWRSSLLSSQPDLVSWGNVRDPDVRAAWGASAERARVEVRRTLVEGRERHPEIDSYALQHVEQCWRKRS